MGQRSLTVIAPTVSLPNFLDVLGSEDTVQAVHKSRESASGGRPILEFFFAVWSQSVAGQKGPVVELRRRQKLANIIFKVEKRSVTDGYCLEKARK